MENSNTISTAPQGSTLIRAERAHGRIYCLIEIKIFENTVYCISVTDDEFSAELVSNDRVGALRLFEALCDEGIPSYHLFDIVSDSKREYLTNNSK